MTGTWDPGTMVAGYRIERVLGGGGMGTVYLVAHPRLPRHDALKVLALEHGADPEFRARFLREAELLARLDHPPGRWLVVSTRRIAPDCCIVM
jgi:serine/threonine protein kinase